MVPAANSLLKLLKVPSLTRTLSGESDQMLKATTGAIPRTFSGEMDQLALNTVQRTASGVFSGGSSPVINSANVAASSFLSGASVQVLKLATTGSNNVLGDISNFLPGALKKAPSIKAGSAISGEIILPAKLAQKVDNVLPVSKAVQVANPTPNQNILIAPAIKNIRPPVIAEFLTSEPNVVLITATKAFQDKHTSIVRNNLAANNGDLNTVLFSRVTGVASKADPTDKARSIFTGMAEYQTFRYDGFTKKWATSSLRKVGLVTMGGKIETAGPKRLYTIDHMVNAL